MIATNGRSLPLLRIVVLAAGFSIRLGRPKALARIHGRTLLDRTLRVLAPFSQRTRIVVVIPAGAGRYNLVFNDVLDRDAPLFGQTLNSLAGHLCYFIRASARYPAASLT